MRSQAAAIEVILNFRGRSNFTPLTPVAVDEFPMHRRLWHLVGDRTKICDGDQRWNSDPEGVVGIGVKPI